MVGGLTLRDGAPRKRLPGTGLPFQTRDLPIINVLRSRSNQRQFSLPAKLKTNGWSAGKRRRLKVANIRSACGGAGRVHGAAKTGVLP